MDKEIVIIIDAEGNLFSLWTDEIDLRTAGICDSWRASDIIWNIDTQEWDVILPDHTIIGSWKSREEAIRNEIKYLQDRM